MNTQSKQDRIDFAIGALGASGISWYATRDPLNESDRQYLAVASGGYVGYALAWNFYTPPYRKGKRLPPVNLVAATLGAGAAWLLRRSLSADTRQTFDRALTVAGVAGATSVAATRAADALDLGSSSTLATLGASAAAGALVYRATKSSTPAVGMLPPYRG